MDRPRAGAHGHDVHQRNPDAGGDSHRRREPGASGLARRRSAGLGDAPAGHPQRGFRVARRRALAHLSRRPCSPGAPRRGPRARRIRDRPDDDRRSGRRAPAVDQGLCQPARHRSRPRHRQHLPARARAHGPRGTRRDGTSGQALPRPRRDRHEHESRGRRRASRSDPCARRPSHPCRSRSSGSPRT